MSLSTPVKPTEIKEFAAASPCIYPQSNATGKTIREELDGLVHNKNKCAAFYLDTTEHERNPFKTEGEDHHQGLARTHKLTDGAVYFFLTHSEMDPGDKGKLMQFKYTGPLDNEHIITTNPHTVAKCTQYLYLEEQHPCDLVFLQDLNNADAGYLFVTEQAVTHSVSVYFWEPGKDLVRIGVIELVDPYNNPNYIFLDRDGDYYYLGIISTKTVEKVKYISQGFGIQKVIVHTGDSDRDQTEKGYLYRAKCDELFPVCEKGKLSVSAFKFYAPGMFDYKLNGYFPCQVKLVRDVTKKWYLLAFRCDPDDYETGTDYIDYREIQFDPFRLGDIIGSVHIYLLPGNTSFASTGTCYVEKTGRLLVSSSFRWSNDEGPGSSSYVSRVDECPSV